MQGNFSFAHALLERLRGAAELTATAYDSESILKAKYGDSSSHIEAIKELGGTILYSVVMLAFRLADSNEHPDKEQRTRQN